MRRVGWLLVPPALFLAVFFVWPVVRILYEGLHGDGGWRIGALADVVTDERLRRIAWFTTWQAVASTALALVLGLPGAWCLARLRFPGRTLLRALVTVPFVLPTVVVASAFLSLIGPRGVLGVDLRGGVWAILLAHAFFNYAVVVRTVGGLWAHLDPAIEDAARTLGASRLRAFREVTWPLLRPAVVAAASIVFLFCFTSFGVVLVLGGVRRATIETEIYRATVERLDLPLAAALSILQFAVVLATLLVFARAGRLTGGHGRLAPTADASRPPRERWERLGMAGNLAVMGLLLGAPMAILVERSLRVGDGYGLAWWRALSKLPEQSALFVPPLDAVRHSLGVALASTAMAVVLGACAAFGIAGSGRTGRSVHTVLLVPLGISAVTLGFGFVLALADPPLDLRSSWWIVPIAHALIAIPFVVQLVLPVLRAIDPRLREAAAVLGASPARAWREVDLPMVWRALLVAAGFSFAVSLGEFGATAFLARADEPTVPVAIYRLLGQPGVAAFGAAMAMSVVLMALTALAILAIERFRLPGSGNF